MKSILTIVADIKKYGRRKKRQNRIANILVNMKNYIIKNIIVVEQNMSMIMITIIDEEKGEFLSDIST